jgi:hypothetical protein
MPTVSFFGKSLELPVTFVSSKANTRDKTAWHFGSYITVKLFSQISEIRVHTGNRVFPGRNASGEAGAWILIGDIIKTTSELADSRSLPTSNLASMVAFTQVSEAHLAVGTVLNVGLASAKFSGMGGEYQAEYVSGPPIRFVPIIGKRWHQIAGHA